jgi:hypothetical protein
MKELTHFIGGKHANGTSVRFCDGFEPMTGEVISRVPLASKAEVRAAVENAIAAQAAWAATNPQRRARVLIKFLELVARAWPFEIKFGAFDAAKILDRKSANLHYFAVPLSSLGMEGQTTIGWLPPSHIALRLSSSRPIHSSSRRGAILSGSISIHRSARSSIALTRRAKPMPSIAPNR